METSIAIEILNLLLDATRKKMMVWQVDAHKEEDIFYSELGTDAFGIELIHLSRSEENTCERALARIQGNKIYVILRVRTSHEVAGQNQPPRGA